MQFLIRNPKDFWSGVIFICTGSASLFISSDYERGTAGIMGPGYFPTALGLLLAVIGLVSLIRSVIVRGDAIGRFNIGKGLLILLAILMFGVLVRGAGLAAAIVVLVMIAGYANARFNAGRYLILALCMAVLCVLVFIQALGLPIPMFGNWLGH